MEKTSKQSKIPVLIIIVVFAVVIASGYYNFFIKGDYLVTKQISCDPKIDSCFVSDCQANDSSCDQTTTYKKISIPSKYAGSDYNSLTCTAGDANCRIITCSADTVEDGEKCFQ